MVCASEKYASEIEIFTSGRGFRTRISRSSVQKRRFHQPMIRQFGQTDFFNRIGREQPVMMSRLLRVRSVYTGLLSGLDRPKLVYLSRVTLAHQFSAHRPTRRRRHAGYPKGSLPPAAVDLIQNAHHLVSHRWL